MVYSIPDLTILQTIQYKKSVERRIFSPNICDLSSDNQLLVANINASILKVWQYSGAGSDAKFREAQRISSDGSKSKVECMAMSHDGSVVVVGSRDRTLRIWSQNSSISESVADSVDTQISEFKMILSTDKNRYQETQILSANTDSVSCVDICKRSKNYIVSGSNDGRILLWKFNEENSRYVYKVNLLTQ